MRAGGALEHQRARLADDHAAARQFAEALRGAPGIQLPPHPIDSNIVQFAVSGIAAPELVQRAAERGVLLNATSKRTLRAVTHLDISSAQAVRAAGVLRLLVGP